MAILWLVIFWLVQAASQALFKYGSLHPSRWLFGFVAGNVLVVASIWLLMLLYRSMNPSIALGLGTGGAFLCAQAVLIVVFRASVGPAQWAALALVSAGMGLFAIGAKGQ